MPSQSDECCVCLEITDNLTKCHHHLCQICIPKLQKPNCPICRTVLDTVDSWLADPPPVRFNLILLDNLPPFVDVGVWRRILVIPFETQFMENPST